MTRRGRHRARSPRLDRPGGRSPGHRQRDAAGSTFSESIIVAFAACLLAFHTGPV